MEFKTIRYEVEDQIGWITLNRPTMMNSMSKAMYKEFVQVIDLIENDPNVRVVIFTGEGDAFCTGADMFEFGVAKRGLYELFDYITATLNALDAIEYCSKPTIAAVNGLALAGGFELTLLCDIVIASRDATFGIPEATLGIACGTAVSKIQKVLPKHLALQLMLTGETISAKEAEKMGLVNEVSPSGPEKLREAVLKMAEKLKKAAPLSQKYIKHIWHQAPHNYDYWYTVMSQLFATADAEEGLAAFFERRKPNWKGK
jgi:enoyl-CoA hydratase/carnithine racemase